MHIRNFFKREIDWEEELFAQCFKITKIVPFSPKLHMLILARKFKLFLFEKKVNVVKWDFFF